MASYCPKCNHKLRIRDWRPNCPNCGINLVFYGLEDRLLDDADKAESEHAHFQKKVDRLKAVYVGDKLVIARFVSYFLPLLALLLPLGRINFTAPFIGVHDRIVNLVTIISGANNLNFDAVFNLMSTDSFGKMFLFFLVSLVCVVIGFVLGIISLIAIGPSWKKNNCTSNIVLCVIRILLGIAALVSYFMFSAQASTAIPGIINSASVSWGAFIYVLILFAPLVLNILIRKRGGVTVNYKPCFVGGIPSDEFDEMIKAGKSIHEIREMMNEIKNQNAEEQPEEEAKETADTANSTK